MTKETTAKANGIINIIENLENNIKRLQHALNHSFVKREMSLNILNTSQEDGYVFIPKEIMKDVIYMTLCECQSLLSNYKKQLSEL